MHHFLPPLILTLSIPKSSLKSQYGVCANTIASSNGNTAVGTAVFSYFFWINQQTSRSYIQLTNYIIFRLYTSRFPLLKQTTRVDSNPTFRCPSNTSKWDALPIHQNEQYMLYRAKKVQLEPKLWQFWYWSSFLKLLTYTHMRMKYLKQKICWQILKSQANYKSRQQSDISMPFEYIETSNMCFTERKKSH